MASDRRMQCFIDQLFPTIWSRHMIPVEQLHLPELSGLSFKEISPALIELLSKAIWVQSKIALYHWAHFLSRHYDTMVSSAKKFVLYVTYACNTTSYNIQDHYERFVVVCSLLVGFGANFYYSGNPEVVKYIPQILAVFFERVLMTSFYERGGWKRLEKYLLRQKYLGWYDEIQFECPDETAQEKATRESNFFKKVETTILASTYKDYNVDGINEKDVECDLETVQIADEILQYLSKTSPKKKGSKTSKSSATSKTFEETRVIVKKDADKEMRELVQRARLDTLLETVLSKIEKDSNASSANVFEDQFSNASLQAESTVQFDNMREPTIRFTKTKTQIVLESIDDNPNTFPFIEKTYEASVASNVPNTVNKTELIVGHQPETGESSRKPLKTKKRKASEVQDCSLHHSPLSVEKIKEIMSSSFSNNTESNSCAPEPIRETDLISYENGESIVCNLEPIKKNNDPNCKKHEENRYSNHTAIKNNQFQISDIPSEINGTSGVHKNSENSAQDEESKSNVFKEITANDNEQRNTGCSKDDSSNSKREENGSASNYEPSIESYLQSENFRVEDVYTPVNCSSNKQAKYKNKREAMDAIIRIVENLSSKIEMFNCMLDSLVWDLKKDDS